ncbi:MAG TPA: hypothetical protein VHO72_14305 [Bacteroidales bacterium]|nr:hypothetical protein [Bacteroidales bacterium]
MNLSKLSVILWLSFAVFVTACNLHGKNSNEPKLFVDFDSISVHLKYADCAFTIPSPQQTSELIRICNLEFNPNLLAPTDKESEYNTTFKKSLALGIWGANISYLNLYRQKELANKYFHSIKRTLIDMEIYPLIDNKLADKLMDNFGDNDSITYYLAELYRQSSNLLESNERRDLNALIIAGGWIESFFYITSLYESTKDERLFQTLLYQGELLGNLIKILSPFYKKSPEYTNLVDGLIKISYEFEVIDKENRTNSIKTDTILKFTIINNDAKYILTGSKLERLHKMVSAFRNKTEN